MRKMRILIVEDEESLLKLETILLTVKGCEPDNKNIDKYR